MKLTIHDQVKNILAASSQARNSDKELEIIFMYKSGMNLTAEQVATFRKMPSMETIRRERQRIQSDRPQDGYVGQYKPTQKVLDYRFEKFKEMKQSHAERPAQILEPELTRSEQLRLYGGV